MEMQDQLRQQLQQRGMAPPPAQPAPTPAPAQPAPPTQPPARDHGHDHDHDHGAELLSFDEARIVLAQHRHGHDDHGHGHSHDDHDHDHAHAEPGGIIHVELPREKWQLSAILVKARGPFQAQQLLYHYRMIDPTAVAVSPAVVMRDFFDTFLRNTTLVLLLIAIMVTIVAAVGILVSIYNSVSARKREIAILRALGATRTRILSLICLEAGLVGLIGGILGLIGGHLIAAGGSAYLDRLIGSGIDWTAIHYHELLYLLAVVLIAVLAGLVPALKAYRTPVATNLTAA
jgi:Flp pilus assembly pilin Flp